METNGKEREAFFVFDEKLNRAVNRRRINGRAGNWKSSYIRGEEKNRMKRIEKDRTN